MRGRSKAFDWAALAIMIGLGLGLLCIERPSQAGTGGRIALVIGNSAYRELKVLTNPKNDATAVAQALKGLGYRLVGRDGQPKDGPELDLDQKALLKAVNSFAKAAAGQEIAFLYYAGHGFQDGVNSYLVPVDVPKPENPEELDMLKGRSIPLEKVVGPVDGKAQLSVAVFDACREIPELDAMTERNRSSGLSGDSGSFRGGLMAMRGGVREHSTPTSRLVAYSGAAGQLVKDGAGEHSPYTQLLLDQLNAVTREQKNVELTLFFNRVAWEFRDRQEGQQPLLEVAVKPDSFYLLPGPAVLAPVSTPPSPPDYDLKQWESAEGCATVACYKAYITAYPQGRFVAMAEAKIKKLATTAAPAPPPATVAVATPAPPVVPPPDPTALKRLDTQLAVVGQLLTKNRVKAARRALDDAKTLDQQGKVDAFRRKQSGILQETAQSFLEHGQRDLARQVLEDLRQWDSQSPEYQTLRNRLAR